MPTMNKVAVPTFPHILLVILLLLTSDLHSKAPHTCLDIPGRPTRAYVKLADINLGGLISISESSSQFLCGDKIRLPILQQMVEVIAFAIDRVNADDTILPNVRLGFAILDDCSKESTAAAQALRFISRKTKTDCRTFWNETSTEDNFDEYYDVVGILGPLRSANSIAVSQILGAAQIPQISFLSTSDILSRKDIHPFFLRVVPPDANQMKAILKFIAENGWSYFSVLYSEGSYGELAYEMIRKTIRNMTLCIATRHKLYINMGIADYRKIILDLKRHERARVVILVSGDEKMQKTFQAAHDLVDDGTFIWIGTDGWADRVSSLASVYRDTVAGSFTTTFIAPQSDDFNEYFRSLKPNTSTNPWFREFWERMFNCSFGASTCDESWDIKRSPNYYVISQAVYGIDAVYAYAHALHELLTDNCPYAKGIEARACVNGPLLLKHLKNISFFGHTGLVHFNDYGDRTGKYIIKQIIPGKKVFQRKVIVVDAEKDYKIIKINSISWDYFLPLDLNFGPNARIPYPPSTDIRLDSSTPLSVCSRLCDVKERIIYKEPSCCWDCKPCNNNEKLMSNSTGCEECPQFFWPDESTNFTSCIPIEPTFPVPSDPLVIILICFSAAGVISTGLVFLIFVRHRDVRVIKASSRELSFFQLVAIFLGYLTIMVYVMRPSNKLCALIYFLFSLSFNSLYAPLLIKTIRIYRIFQSANKGRRALKAVSPLIQVIISFIIIFGQIVICSIVTVICQPRARLKSHSRNERYVELYCDLTKSGLLSFIAYNLTLVCLCTLFAFKTRKLPDNFNESKFISMCVFTTLILWLAIVPSFLTTSREYMRSLLLATALLFNHSVALVFLFVSRIYAIFNVDEDTSEGAAPGTNVSNFQSRQRNSILPINTISNSGNHLVPGSSP